MIPFLDLKPQYKELQGPINERIQTILNHGQFILGPEVAECEKALAEFTGSPYCLTMSSGTDALMAALMALDIKPGDEVITTAFSFFATAEVISLLGANPIFVDIDPKTYNLNPKLIEAAITKKTKVIMPVSLYGQVADMDEINAIAEKHHLTVLEDAAQSFGGVYKGKRSGNVSKISGTSFFPAKPLGCYGDGGAVFTTDKNLYDRMVRIRVHGQESRYHHVELGLNARLDTIQCAVITEKLKRFPWELKRRDEIAQNYTKAFKSLEGRLVTPFVKEGNVSAWAQYTVLVDNRDQFAAKLKDHGVPTSVHYPSSITQQPVYKHLAGKFHLPETDHASSQCISLAMYPDLTAENQDRVIAAVLDVMK
jgi:UDP-2-acetamido-2-deoxy-ribo-hexuluronate aminotransferase